MSNTTHWNWGIFFEAPPYGGEIYLNWLLNGMMVTIALSICAWFIAFTFGSFFGILRTVPNRFLNFISRAYVEIFRNVPLLVQFFVWVYIFPLFLPAMIQDWLNQHNQMLVIFIYSTIALGLFTGARICEQVRTTIQSLPRGQKNAGLALGLTLPQTYRYILLPVAYRRAVPPLTSEMLNMIKNSAVASIAGLLELSGQANNLRENTQQAYESFIAVTLGYVLINLIVIQLMRIVEKKARLPGMIGGK